MPTTWAGSQFRIDQRAVLHVDGIRTILFSVITHKDRIPVGFTVDRAILYMDIFHGELRGHIIVAGISAPSGEDQCSISAARAGCMAIFKGKVLNGLQAICGRVFDSDQTGSCHPRIFRTPILDGMAMAIQWEGGVRKAGTVVWGNGGKCRGGQPCKIQIRDDMNGDIRVGEKILFFIKIQPIIHTGNGIISLGAGPQRCNSLYRRICAGVCFYCMGRYCYARQHRNQHTDGCNRRDHTCFLSEHSHVPPLWFLWRLFWTYFPYKRLLYSIILTQPLWKIKHLMLFF